MCWIEVSAFSSSSFLLSHLKDNQGRVLNKYLNCRKAIYWIKSIDRCQTWDDHMLWRRVQLQESLLEGLAEGVLEAGHRHAVGPVALSVAVCCRGGEQLYMEQHNTDVRKPSGSYTAKNWLYRKYSALNSAPVTTSTYLSVCATCTNSHKHIGKNKAILSVLCFKQLYNRPFKSEALLQILITIYYLNTAHCLLNKNK